MYININNKQIKIKIIDKWFKKILKIIYNPKMSYGLLFPNCNHIHIYSNNEGIDLIFLNEKNSIIYKYQNVIPGKTIKILEDRKKTNALELPQNISNNLKIGDILTFENKHII